MYDFAHAILLIFVGGVFTWLLQQYRIMRSEEALLISDHIKDLEKVSDFAMQYWLSKPNKVQDIFHAAALKTKLATTVKFYPHIAEVCGENLDTYKTLLIRLNSIATGGKFESKKREIDYGRAIDTVNTVNEIIILLRMTRRELTSLKNLLRSIKKNISKKWDNYDKWVNTYNNR